MTSASIVTTHPAEDRQLFIGALGSPLTSDDGYLFREKLNGDKHKAGSGTDYSFLSVSLSSVIVWVDVAASVHNRFMTMA